LQNSEAFEFGSFKSTADVGDVSKMHDSGEAVFSVKSMIVENSVAVSISVELIADLGGAEPDTESISIVSSAIEGSGAKVDEDFKFLLGKTIVMGGVASTSESEEKAGTKSASEDNRMDLSIGLVEFMILVRLSNVF
jgi:hypothetical protein